MVKCTLSKDINNCPFCDKEKMECHKDDTNCAFRREYKEEPTAKYERKERWYEKYYKNSRPAK